jgi:hypothetical protein
MLLGIPGGGAFCVLPTVATMNNRVEKAGHARSIRLIGNLPADVAYKDTRTPPGDLYVVHAS